MPGLFGYWSNNPQDEVGEWLDEMGASMRHQPGLKTELKKSPGFGAGRVHLGVFQPIAQPAMDDSKRYALWLDGEFNNATDLRRMLEGQHRAIMSDAALALELFLQAGWDFLSAVDGLFAIALYDHHAHELTLVSDRYGLRPLYWIETANGFGYAGEVKATLKVPDVNVRIDPLAVQEWFSFGYLLENRTWIDGVELFPSATVMQVTQNGIECQRYWSWHDIQPLPASVDENEIIEELGRLWIQAVQRQVDEKSIGQLLSGGLDSRAILAALPPTQHPYHTLTFGVRGCDDERIARQVAEIKGVPHHFVEIRSDNWLVPRIDAVWRTDGLLRILDMHGAEIGCDASASQIMDVCLHGALGDGILGGSHLFPLDASTSYLKRRLISPTVIAVPTVQATVESYNAFIHQLESAQAHYIEQRQRRFINTGLIQMSAHWEFRLPFADRDLLSFALAIPDDLIRDSRVYKQMLLQECPMFFQNIPWQKTGLPISASLQQKRSKEFRLFLKKSLHFAARKLGLTLPAGRVNYTNYPLWLRTEPARSFVTRLLMDDSALHYEYVDADIARSVERGFMESNDNSSLQTVGLLLGFEVYLRQLYASETFHHQLRRSGLDPLVAE